MSILPETTWNSFYPDALPVYTYENFLKAVAKFPKFCNDPAADNPDLENSCKVELSAFLAHMKHESGSLIYVEEIGCSVSGSSCSGYSASSTIYPATPGQKYYGRGPFQLSWNYNYGQFSTAAFNGGLGDRQILLDDPHQVATDGKLAFMSALWFYMYPQSPKPSMHDAILGLFQTNNVDVNNNICSGCFGTTTNIINGGLECGFFSITEQKRVEYFDNYCQALGATCPQDGKSCQTQSTGIPVGSGGSSNMWLEKNPNQPFACKVTPWVSGYSIYPENDYKRCVCDSWDAGNPDCLLPAEPCDDDNNPPDDNPPDDNPPDDNPPDDNTPDDNTPAENNAWEDHDWIVDYQVIDGILHGVTDETDRRIQASRNLPADAVTDYLTMDNVQRAMSVMSENKWNQLFPQANALYSYENFMKAIARYPKFCGEAMDADIVRACKTELSAIMAHMKQSSVNLIYSANINCSGPWSGLAVCDYVFQSEQYTAVSGQQYYGRGPFMLSYNTNYGQMSNAVLNDSQNLLDNPEQLTTDGELSFMSALWYYMYPQYPKPSMHDAILGFFEPSQADIDANICTGCFGTTTNLIDG